jgi:hypothetical protein
MHTLRIGADPEAAFDTGQRLAAEIIKATREGAGPAVATALARGIFSGAMASLQVYCGDPEVQRYFAALLASDKTTTTGPSVPNAGMH